MARMTGGLISLSCTNCNSKQNVMWWKGSEDSSAAESNERTLRGLACSCPDPHWSLPSGGSVSFKPGTAGRETIAVYQLPDGDYMVPDSANPYSPMARSAAESGVRREIASLRELQSFQREQRARKREIWQRMIDNGEFASAGLEPTYQQLEEALYRSGHNDALDWTEASRAAGEGLTRNEMKERRERQIEGQRRMQELREKGVRIGRGDDLKRYERLKGRR